MSYKINLHAHSRYSDGSNTIREMAVQCQALGFSACVITDHVYRKELGAPNSWGMDMVKLTAACKEAQTVSNSLRYPVLIGAEFTIGYGEEILVYGLEAVKELMRRRDRKYEVDYSDLRDVRRMFNCAAIIAHPMNPGAFIYEDAVDGLEFCNSGAPMFRRRPIPRHLSHLTPWGNSDAHCDYALSKGWNVVPIDVKCEADLIDLIKNHAPSLMHTTSARTLGDLMMEATA